jgi:NTE family protein
MKGTGMRPKLALVLGGGGSRGIAHVGVLDVFFREKIQIDLIVGTSMGAIVGALYASGIKPQIIGERMSSLQGLNLLGMNLFSARARQRNVAEQLKEALSGKTFDDLQIKLVVTAVDMVSGQEVVLDKGELIPALLASSAVPAVFPPVQLNGMQLSDGGVIDSVATHVAYQYGAQAVIAVDVYPALEQSNPWVDPVTAVMGFELPFQLPGIDRSPSMLSSIWRSYRVLMWYTHQRRLEAHPPHVLLRPPVHDTPSLDFQDLQGLYYAGYQEAEQHLDKIKALNHLPNASADG